MSCYSDSMRKSWYAIGLSSEFGSQPVASKLLGESLVSWRDKRGKVNALRDLCIHRGTALSLGKVEGCEIVCPYHGWRFNGDGKYTHIPQPLEPCRVPKKAEIQSYLCAEWYGLVWVALEKPLWSLPEVPELKSSDYKVVPTEPFPWKSSAARQVENVTDFAHLPFVHPELLGDPNRTVVPEHRVTSDENVLHYKFTRPEARNTEAFPIFANGVQVDPVRTNTYELHLPYSIVLRISWGAKERNASLFTSLPIDEKNFNGFNIIGRNYNFDQPDEITMRFEEIIFGQDQRIVESQRPEQVPFDLSDEIHLCFDAVAVSYRREMRRLGYAV